MAMSSSATYVWTIRWRLEVLKWICNFEFVMFTHMLTFITISTLSRQPTLHWARGWAKLNQLATQCLHWPFQPLIPLHWRHCRTRQRLCSHKKNHYYCRVLQIIPTLVQLTCAGKALFYFILFIFSFFLIFFITTLDHPFHRSFNGIVHKAMIHNAKWIKEWNWCNLILFRLKHTIKPVENTLGKQQTLRQLKLLIPISCFSVNWLAIYNPLLKIQ